MRKKCFLLVDATDIRDALSFQSIDDFIYTQYQNSCEEMPLTDENINNDIVEALNTLYQTNDTEQSKYIKMYLRRMLNWKKAAKYIRENYDIPEDLSTIFVRIWW